MAQDWFVDKNICVDTKEKQFNDNKVDYTTL